LECTNAQSSSLCRDRRCRPQQPPDQPNNQRYKHPEEDERSQKDQNDPSRPTHIRDIATYRGGGIALDAPSEYGYVALHVHLFAQANATAKRRYVASDLPLILNDDAAPERSHVSGNLPSHSDAAAKACRFADLLPGANRNIPSRLGTLVIADREGRGREDKASEQARQKQS
jgi:hypothetical protein